MDEILDDLAAETEALVRLVAPLEEEGWATVTPSEPWTVSDQIAHLALFDEQALLAATDPDAFADQLQDTLADNSSDIGDLHRARQPDTGKAILRWWEGARSDLIGAYRGIDPDQRLLWYGPAMRARTSAVARLMETWAHGTDVADALGSGLPVTDRLFRIADLGVRTYSWAFRNRSMEVPSQRVRVALRGPSGTTRIWNDECSASITGPVEEFCLVVAQRRHPADTHLVVEGGLARRWMEIAQVFAGPPGPGRPPESRSA